MVSHEIIRLYDAYTHGQVSRRQFLSSLAVLAGGTAAAMSLLPLLENDYRRIAAEEPGSDLHEDYITFTGPSGEIRAYRAAPVIEGPRPVVIVIHENRGLNPYIEEVARRVAGAGFIAIAPDALSPFGGTPSDSDQAREMIGALDMEKTIGDFVAAVNFASAMESSTGKVGCVGFCWGGRMSNQLAVRSPDLKAAVAFYGGQPDPADVPRIKAAVMLHYAALDDRINAGISSYVDALNSAGVDYSLHMYEDVHHAFHNHTSPTRYNEEAAKLAWQRTIAFFNVHLA